MATRKSPKPPELDSGQGANSVKKTVATVSHAPDPNPQDHVTELNMKHQCHGMDKLWELGCLGGIIAENDRHLKGADLPGGGGGKPHPANFFIQKFLLVRASNNHPVGQNLNNFPGWWNLREVLVIPWNTGMI